MRVRPKRVWLQIISYYAHIKEWRIDNEKWRIWINDLFSIIYPDFKNLNTFGKILNLPIIK